MGRQFCSVFTRARALSMMHLAGKPPQATQLRVPVMRRTCYAFCHGQSIEEDPRIDSRADELILLPLSLSFPQAS